MKFTDLDVYAVLKVTDNSVIRVYNVYTNLDEAFSAWRTAQILNTKRTNYMLVPATLDVDTNYTSDITNTVAVHIGVSDSTARIRHIANTMSDLAFKFDSVFHFEENVICYAKVIF